MAASYAASAGASHVNFLQRFDAPAKSLYNKKDCKENASGKCGGRRDDEMRKTIRAIYMAAALLLTMSAICLAEPDCLADADLQFVDARGNTGYYADMNSRAFDNDHEVTAQIAVVRADDNHMFVYRTHFNRQAKTYQILSSIVLKYDTKEQLSASDVPMAVLRYADGSPMQNVAEYIFNPQP